MRNTEEGGPGPGGIAEFTLKALLCGLFFGVLFGAANAYLGLKAGLTVSTSIPIAVLSVAVFGALSRLGRLMNLPFLRSGTLLEANLGVLRDAQRMDPAEVGIPLARGSVNYLLGGVRLLQRRQGWILSRNAQELHEA